MGSDPAAVAEALAKHMDTLLRGGPRAAAAAASVAEAAARLPGATVSTSAPVAGGGTSSGSAVYGGSADVVDGELAAVAAAAAAAAAGPSPTESEATAAECVWLFRCLRAKDVFEAFFRKDLAKRLLLGRAASDDAERSVLASLKAECGPSYTSKLEGMMRDVAACRALEADFAEAAPPRAEWAEGDGVVSGGMDFAVQTLTTTHWPSYKAWVPTLPRPLLRPMEVFQEWYRSRHSGRRLVWQHSLGTCTVVGHFRAGRREFVLSELQAALLLLFNGQESLTFAELRGGVGGSGTSSSSSATAGGVGAAGGTGLGAGAAGVAEAGPSDPEVTRSVLSLCVGKHKVLNRIRAGHTASAAATPAELLQPLTRANRTRKPRLRFRAA